MSFSVQLAADQARVKARLVELCKEGSALDDAICHAVLNGGKRLRAFLVYETSRICSVSEEVANAGAAAIELMHAYSLVHDDLPAMDNDDMRRGHPTVHKKWNEWTAILAGDALQTLSFEALSQAPLKANVLLGIVTKLAKSAGREGMVRGQFLDLQSESSSSELTLENLENLQRDKTGALISWSACFGAQASEIDATPFARYAEHLGLAFQIWDDVLDVESSSETLGKTAGKDEASGKATYVSLLGLDAARLQANNQIEAAKAAISSIPSSQNLSQLAEFVISRSY